MSQCDQILQRLLAGEVITPRDAWGIGVAVLHSRISELRGRGHRIDCKMIRHGRSRWGQYSLVRRG